MTKYSRSTARNNRNASPVADDRDVDALLADFDAQEMTSDQALGVMFESFFADDSI